MLQIQVENCHIRYVLVKASLNLLTTHNKKTSYHFS